jgi:hypothetical protein
MIRALVRAGALASFAFAASAGADGFDGKASLECAPAAVAECDGYATCETVPADEIELPPQLNVDFQAKKLVTPDGTRSSPIRSVDVEENTLIVQGSQNGRGWSLAIDRATGKMSGTISESAGAFVVTGSCRAP